MNSTQKSAAAAEAVATLPDATREPARSENREFIRVRPREAHEKFDIPKHRRVPGMSYLWGALKVPYTNIRSRRLAEFRAAGWQFVRAADVPELSGYKPEAHVNKRYIELGIDDEVRADDPVILDGTILMMRPEELTAQADRERTQAAHRQLREHLQRQQEKSAREIGENRTFIRTMAEAPDEAPTDAGREEF